jgi:predicted O-methyltransferase YrrM
MKNYIYTQNWFESKDLESFLEKKNVEINILEIGSFEGKSTIWFLENILLNEKSTITCVDPWVSYSQDHDSFISYDKTIYEWNCEDAKSTFLHNIELSGYQNKVIVEQGLSKDVLLKLILSKNKYDIIFIDGNHTSPFVLIDSILSWYLLKKDGLIIFDDYLWGEINSTISPKLAIDSFINCFGDYIEVIWSDYKKVIKRIK